jgi:formate dehydrogenase iron-sulfur subunit
MLDSLEGKSHKLGHGLTEDIPYFKNQERLTFARCGITDPLSIDDYIAHGGYHGLASALKMSAAEIVTAVTESGLRGRGGAGFPTGIKWKTVHDLKADQKYVACNADEGDSGTFADRMLMEGDPYCLIEGMTIAAVAGGATKGYIYVRSEYPHSVHVLREAIEIARKANWLGDNIQGSGYSFDLFVRMGAGAYICGEETSMLDSLEGKRGIVRYKPPIPAIEGLFGKPTIINNVMSFAAVPIILSKGGEFYKNYGVGRSRGTLAFQLAGNIKQGGLVEKAFGVTTRQLIEDWGGGTATGRPVRAVQVGGPLGAYITVSKFDVPIDYEEFAKVDAMVGHGGFVVFDDTVDMAQQARFAMEFCAIESCGKCTPCRVGDVRVVEVADRIAGGVEPEKQVALLEDLCNTMKFGSLCALGGFTPYPVMSALRHFPEDFRPHPMKEAAE